MTIDEITTTLRAFARSRKSGCRACPEYNSWDYEACEYDEEQDKDFVVPGWYEIIRNWYEYGCVGIVDDVTHWMELPEAQKEENDGRS